MLLLLHPHPSTPAEHVHKISVEAWRRGGRLALRYRLEGRLDRLVIPPPARPRRCDGLWEHTCFEAFVRAEGGPEYFELNFAPSALWQGYEFEGERTGKEEAGLDPPRMQCWSDSARLELSAEIDGLPGAQPWHTGLCAVVEDVDGQMSYWALAHPSDEPDFHNPRSFALMLP